MLSLLSFKRRVKIHTQKSQNIHLFLSKKTGFSDQLVISILSLADPMKKKVVSKGVTVHFRLHLSVTIQHLILKGLYYIVCTSGSACVSSRRRRRARFCFLSSFVLTDFFPSTS